MSIQHTILISMQMKTSNSTHPFLYFSLFPFFSPRHSSNQPLQLSGLHPLEPNHQQQALAQQQQPAYQHSGQQQQPPRLGALPLVKQQLPPQEEACLDKQPLQHSAKEQLQVVEEALEAQHLVLLPPPRPQELLAVFQVAEAAV